MIHGLKEKIKQSKIYKIIKNTMAIIGLIFTIVMVLALLTPNKPSEEKTVIEKVETITPEEKIINELFSKNSFLGTIKEIKKQETKYLITTDNYIYYLSFVEGNMNKITLVAKENFEFSFEIKNNTVDKALFVEATTITIPGWIEAKQLDTKIKSQFSAWDGSHRNLVDVVKKNLNDPSSFKHNETKYGYNKKTKTIKLQMTFRAKNAFGALILNTAIATADLEGNILSLDIQ